MFVKGHKSGRGAKGKSGRKSKVEELKEYIKNHQEEIANETILMLAKTHIVNKLVNCPTAGDAKDIALPIYLKSVKDVKDLNIIMPKPILYAICSHNSTEEDNSDAEENKSGDRGNISEQNNLNHSLLDTLEPVGQDTKDN